MGKRRHCSFYLATPQTLHVCVCVCLKHSRRVASHLGQASTWAHLHNVTVITNDFPRSCLAEPGAGQEEEYCGWDGAKRVRQAGDYKVTSQALCLRPCSFCQEHVNVLMKCKRGGGGGGIHING